jgi:CDP-glycerol glycerophosphotransferase (TagB/SpsB family)
MTKKTVCGNFTRFAQKTAKLDSPSIENIARTVLADNILCIKSNENKTPLYRAKLVLYASFYRPARIVVHFLRKPWKTQKQAF